MASRPVDRSAPFGLGIQIESALLASALESLRSQVRRNVLRSAGRKVAKVMKAEVKRRTDAVDPTTHILRKSPDAIVKVYAATNTVAVVGGIKRGDVRETFLRKDYRTGDVYESATPRKMYAPNYAHLAGKGRRGLSFKLIQEEIAGKLRELMADALRDELEKRF